MGVSSAISGDRCGEDGIEVELQAGEQVIIVVDGVNHGAWVLNITPAGP